MPLNAVRISIENKGSSVWVMQRRQKLRYAGRYNLYNNGTPSCSYTNTMVPSFSSLASPVSVPPTPLIQQPIQRDAVSIPDAYSRYANFKYRLWFIWYIWYTRPAETGRGPPWRTIVCGADGDVDLWLWEDEDEEYIRGFASLHSFAEMPVVGWDDACSALEARLSRTAGSVGPSSHLTPQPRFRFAWLIDPLWGKKNEKRLSCLTPQTRFRFIAWLIVAGPVRKDQLLRRQEGYRRVDTLINDWAGSTALQVRGVENSCDTCRISHFLPIWSGTMLDMYSLEDLRSIPWDRSCNCFHR
jgi:hypothetical protein